MKDYIIYDNYDILLDYHKELHKNAKIKKIPKEFVEGHFSYFLTLLRQNINFNTAKILSNMIWKIL